MKTYVDCLPCLLNQALKAARAATDDERIHREVVNAVAGMIPRLSLELIPPEITQQVYRLICQILGDSDPFRKAKAEANQAGLALYPRLKKLVADSEDRLLAACKLAIAGNSIDLGPDFDAGIIDDLIVMSLSSPLTINDYEKFRSGISSSRYILYLGDNAGEIVFDRVLIEELRQIKPLDISFVVRERPIINDVTKEDALAVGMDKVASIISSGSDAPATILSQCSPDILRLYHSADLIIAKGQGNYEALDQEQGNIFFMLRAKCPLIARLLGVRVGDAILKHHMVLAKNASIPSYQKGGKAG